MSLFSKKDSFIGIDLGTSSIKLVELKGDPVGPKLMTYGLIEEPTDIIKSSSDEAQKRIINLLKVLIKKTRVSSDKIVAALPSFTVFSSIISLPYMSKKDLNAAVRWEAKKFVPMPLEEMVLDWRILRDAEESEKDDSKKDDKEKSDKVKEKKNFKTLLTAAPQSLVKKYINIFKALELQIVSLETEAFALERSLIGQDMSPMMIVDIGALATDISIISGGVPILNRGIDVGGETITKAVANSLNIDLERAEQFKRDFGLISSEMQGQIPKTIEFVITSVINEIKHVFNLYRNIEETPIEKIILSGGSAFLPNLPEYFSKMFNIKVIIGDPWSRVSYPVELKPALEEVGPRFSVAIGLALREII